jgi:benzylsuccinate CoA-transferase BbsF subunit
MSANRPLQGIRVIDFGWILSVPHCCAWLGSLGAEVIRVESMANLDLVRVIAPADAEPGINRGAAFNGLNFSKKGITLNVTTERGRALALDLIGRSDIVTENYATGVFERLGLGYEELRKVNPAIIMLTGSTLGTTGPERMATGWGPNVCSYAGLSMISGHPDGPPSDLGGTWPDYGIGTMMVFALLAALHHRNRTGEGQHVEVAMGECVTAMIPEAVLDYTMNGRETPRMGNRDPHSAPHGVFPCAGDDRWVAIEVHSDAEWEALCGAMGAPGLAGDPRYSTLPARIANVDEVERIVSVWTRQLDPFEVMHELQGRGVAAGPVMSTQDQLTDPHFEARGMLVEIPHPEVGARSVAGLPVRFSAMPELDYGPAPCMGEHNEEVFRGLLGIPEEEFERLRAEQVIF